MRILFLQDHLRIGGTEKQMLALAQYGQENGYNTGVIVFRPGGALKTETAKFSYFKTLQPFNTRIDEWAPGIIGKILTFEPDVIVFMGKVAHLYFLSIRKYIPSATLVATYRSGKPPVPYYRKALQESDGVITNSHTEHTRLIRPWGIPENLIKTVHNGCLVPTNQKKDPTPGKQKLRLLCSAMFRPQKNQLELLSILSQIPESVDWQCTLAGTGKMLKPCKERARQLNLQSRVSFTWSTDLEDLYQSHDIAVLTSDKESLPNSLIEAQCSGLPVVAYLVNGVAECFKEGVSGLGIPFGNQAAFRDALHLMGMDHTKRQSMSEAAVKFARERFDFKARSTEFFEVLKEFHGSRHKKDAH